MKNGFAKALGPALLALAIAVQPAAPALAQPTDYIGVPGPLDHDGLAFELAWSSNPEPRYVKQEYVPAGQTPQRYEQMLLVETLAGPITVSDAVGAQLERLNPRREADPVFNMDLIQNESTGEILLDFLMSERDEAGDYVIEWNAYRYAPLSNVGGGEGVMLYGVSLRGYGDGEDAMAFLQALPGLRSAHLSSLAAADLPRPTINSR